MRYFRKFQNVNPGSGRYLSIAIPKELCHLFMGGMAIIEVLPDGKGVSVRSARIQEE